MAFFTKDFLQFLKDLARNNHRDWFHENKKRYQNSVKDPFYAFVAAVISKAQKLDPEVQIEPKDAVFRINRDIRFSKDKSPYKTHMAAVVSKYGRKNHESPGIYFHFGPEEIYMGGGCYMPSKESLYKIRQAVAENSSEVEKLLADKKFKKVYGEVKGEKNKIIPKEFKPAFEKQPLIAHKQFYYMANYDDENILLRDDLDDFVIEHYKVASGWNAFLKKALN